MSSHQIHLILGSKL